MLTQYQTANIKIICFTMFSNNYAQEGHLQVFMLFCYHFGFVCTSAQFTDVFSLFSPSLNSFPYTQPYFYSPLFHSPILLGSLLSPLSSPLFPPLCLSSPLLSSLHPSLSSLPHPSLSSLLPPFPLLSPLPLPLLSPPPFPLLSPPPFPLLSLPRPFLFSLPCPSPSLLGPAWSSWSPRRARFTRS